MRGSRMRSWSSLGDLPALGGGAARQEGNPAMLRASRMREEMTTSLIGPGAREAIRRRGWSGR